MSDRQIVKLPRSRGPAASPGSVSQRGLLLLPPLNAVLELTLFVLVMLAMDTFVPSFSLNSIEPNPSWLPVLLLSVQYGTVSGLLAAGVCIALSIHTGFPEQDVGENLFVYLLRAWAQPMLWIGAAVLLGQFRTRHIVERAELAQQLTTLSSQRTAIAEYANNLRARCDALERHLASRDGSEPVALLAELARVSTAPAADLAANFQTAIGALLPGASASLVLAHPTRPRLIATANPNATHRVASAETIAADVPLQLLNLMIERPQPISVLTADGERRLAGSALVAVPIESRGAVSGVILVHDMDPQALNAKLLDGLPVLAAALAPSMERLLHQETVELLEPHTAVSGPDGEAGRANVSEPWLKRLWKPWAPAPDDRESELPTTESTRPDPPTRRMVR